MFISKEFRRSIKPLVILNSIFTTGLVEYYFDNKINAIGIIYALFSNTMYVLIFLQYPFHYSYFFKQDIPTFAKAMYKIYRYAEFISFLFTSIAGILRRKKTRRIMLQVDTCNKNMNKLNIPMNWPKCYKQQCYLVILLAFVTITMILMSFRSLEYMNYNFWKMLIYVYLRRFPFILLLITDTSFIFWIRYIKIKLNQLNVLLKSMLNTTIDLPQHKRVFQIWNNDFLASGVHRTCKSNKNIAKLRKIREIHLELIKCARHINDAYGLHNLMSVSAGFILITAATYNQYYYIKSMDYRQHLYITVVYSYLTLYYLFRVFIVCYVCESTATEVYNFTLQLVQNPLSFTACEFFDLNNGLFYSVIGGVTTYLVILIQIGGTPIPISYLNSSESTNY